MNNKIYCKLTDQDMKTHNGFQWTLGKEEVIAKQGGVLCSDSYFHSYEHPLLAVLLNPIHANIKNPRLFLIEVGGESLDDNGLKCGFKEMSLIEEIPLPEISIINKIAFGILCALEVYKNDNFIQWANSWLINKDRSYNAAFNAAYAAYNAYNSANAANAAYAAYNAAYNAYNAASAASAASANAVKVSKNIDFIEIAKKAMEIK